MVVPLNVPPTNEGAHTWQAKQDIPSLVIRNLSACLAAVDPPLQNAKSILLAYCSDATALISAFL